MTGRIAWVRDERGAAAAEMALVLPFLTALLFGSMELGNYFYQEHSVVKQVRNGARYASRLTLSPDYECPDTIFDDSEAEDKIVNVTRTDRVDGSGRAKIAADAEACGDAPAVAVTYRCASSEEFKGIYTGLDGEVPVVKVAAALRYQSLLGLLGMNTTNLCLVAESESAVVGL